VGVLEEVRARLSREAVGVGWLGARQRSIGHRRMVARGSGRAAVIVSPGRLA
jgi:hypothetical protein